MVPLSKIDHFKFLETVRSNIIHLRKILNCEIISLLDIMAFRRVGAVILLVTNIDNSTKFYRDTLGLVVKNATNEWTEFFTSGTVLALHPAKTRVKPNPGMLVGFMVSDLESIAASLKAKNVKFFKEPKEESFGKHAIIEDPDGHLISIAEIKSAPTEGFDLMGLIGAE